MKSPKKTKRTIRTLDPSKLTVVVTGESQMDPAGLIELKGVCQKLGLAGIYLLEQDEYDSGHTAKVTSINRKDLALDPAVADYVMTCSFTDSRAIRTLIERMGKKARPRARAVYFGSHEGAAVKGRWLTKGIQKVLFDLDAESANSGLFVCRKEVFKDLLRVIPANAQLDNNTVHYAAERLGYRKRLLPVNLKAPLSYKSAGAVVKQRLGLMYQWYLGRPFQKFKEEKWWKTSRAWSSENKAAWRMLFAALAILIFIGMPVLSFDYGVTWDEKIENDYGKDALNYLLTGGKDRRCFDQSIHLYAPMRNYGMLFNVPAAAVSKFISPLGEFETKHLLNALTGFLAMLFIGLTAKNIGGWRTGFLTMLFLFLSPRFFGHSMTNPKDIPFAAGYVIGVWAIIKIFEELPKLRWRTVFWAILGIGFVMGIRIGGLMVLCYLAMMMGLHWIGEIKKRGLSKSWTLVPRYAGYFLAVTAGSYLIAICTWPYALEGPVKHPLEALSAITNVQYIVSYELFSGVRTNMADLSWNYIPEWMAISMPVFVLLGCAMSPATIWPNKDAYKLKILLFGLFVVIFPMAYVVYRGSVLYNGWRHFLFFAPYVALLGALGWDALFRLKLHPYLPVAAATLLGLGVLKTSAWMVVNHPYQYVYFNELVGGIDGAYGRYETDYYGLSMREGIEWLVENEGIADGREVRVGVNCEIETANYWAKKHSPNITIVWNRHYEKHKNQWDYALFASRTMSRNELVNGSYPPEGTIHTIRVDNTPILAVIKHNNTFLHDGYKAFRANNTTEAIDLFQKALDYDPRSEEAARMLGTAYYVASQPDLALVAFDKALEIWPESYLALFYKSQIMLQRSDYQSTYELALKAIEHKSNIQGAHLNAGRAAMQMGHFDASRKHLEDSFKYSGGDRNMQSDIHMLFGQSFLLQVQAGASNLTPAQSNEYLTNAVNQLARSVEINPKNRNALRFLISGLEMLGQEDKAQQYRQMLAGL